VAEAVLADALEDLIEEGKADSETEIQMVMVKEEDPRCMMLFAINVEKIVKFHLNPQETSRFYVAIVLDLVEVHPQILETEVLKDKVKVQVQVFRRNNLKSLTEKSIKY
jgi:hypothetical protein